VGSGVEEANPKAIQHWPSPHLHTELSTDGDNSVTPGPLGYPRWAAGTSRHGTSHEFTGRRLRHRITRSEDAARASSVDGAARAVYTVPVRRSERGARVHEADVPTQSPPAVEDAWLPRTHEDERRAESAQAPPRKGPQTARGLAGRFPRRERLTSSAEFQALFQRGRRIDRPALIVLWREAVGPTRAGFAVSRQLKNAVQRNRARRRLREAYRASRDAAPPGTALVIVGRPAALTAPFAALAAQLRGALAAVPAARGGR
jgi:ribonuclease P protein component